MIGVGLVGFIDLLTGTEIALSVLYLAPIVLVTWWMGSTAGYRISLLSAATWWGVEFMAEAPYSKSWILFWNAGVRLSFFLVITWQLGRIRFLTLHLEELVRRRTSELASEIARRRQVEGEVAEVSQREQTRLSHELHDHLGAHLAGVAFRMKTLAENLGRRGLKEAGEADRVVQLVNDSINEIRSFARWLSPAETHEGGLAAGLSRLGAEFETLFGVTCLIELPKPLPRLSPEQGRQLYRIAQESIRNAVKHGQAQLTEIRLKVDGSFLEMRVSSDGGDWVPPGEGQAGLGLRIMEYRARILEGTLSISTRPNGGCVVACRVPLTGGGPD